MSARLYRPLGALAFLVFASGAALAGGAVTSTDMTLREGPGDSFRVLANILAGSRVDLKECDLNQWCRVIYDDVVGWVHVRRVETSTRGGSGGTGAPGTDGGSNSTTTTADKDDGGSTPGGKPTRTRKEASTKSGDDKSTGDDSGDEGISAIDGASLPGDSSSSSGSGSPGGSVPSRTDLGGGGSGRH